MTVDNQVHWEALLEFNTVKERPARRSKVKGFWTVSNGKSANDDRNVDQSEIVTPAELKQWKQLDRISGEIGGNESITVYLLIRANFLKALEPLEVIPSQGNGPCAIRTALGLCIIGP